MKRSDKVKNIHRFSIRERLKSFKAAGNGIQSLLKYEHNSRVHLLILILVIAAGFILKIGRTEWLAICAVAGLVFISECMNSAVEYLADRITTDEDDHIRKAKDVAAAGVLIAAATSVITGLIIFVPKIILLIGEMCSNH